MHAQDTIFVNTDIEIELYENRSFGVSQTRLVIPVYNAYTCLIKSWAEVSIDSE